MIALPGIAQKKDTAPADPTIQTLKTVAYLTRYGDKHQDAISFMQAARILGRQPILHFGTPRHLFYLNPDELLAKGRRLAGKDTLLLSLADHIAWELGFRARGRTDGPKTRAAQVKGGSSFTASWTFNGNEPAIVSVIGDGDNDLDLFVYDRDNKVVAQDDSHTDACEVHFTPPENADYKIVVKNWGSSYSDFVIITN